MARIGILPVAGFGVLYLTIYSRYFFTEPIAEIAERYGLTENHVTVILSRVRKKLKLKLLKEGYL